MSLSPLLQAHIQDKFEAVRKLALEGAGLPTCYTQQQRRRPTATGSQRRTRKPVLRRRLVKTC